MGRTIVINEQNCTGCRFCELACSSFKEGQFIPDRSRIRVVHNTLEGWSRPAVCLQCEEPMCLAVCPVQAISRTKTEAGDHLIYQDPEKCIGCHRCLVACPVGAIAFFPKLKSIKCDLCGGSPRCVEFCFYDCLHFVELSEEEREKRNRKIKTLFNRAAVEISNREVSWRRGRFSSDAAAVVPPGPPREKKTIDLKVPPVTR
jgi:Fe-S-cluster-containing hydrogenase component 2